MANDFPRKDALDPCLHCAVGKLVMFRTAGQAEEDAFDVAKGLVESLADMCASWEGADRAELLAHTRHLFERMLGDVENYRWKGDKSAQH